MSGGRADRALRGRRAGAVAGRAVWRRRGPRFCRPLCLTRRARASESSRIWAWPPVLPGPQALAGFPCALLIRPQLPQSPGPEPLPADSAFPRAPAGLGWAPAPDSPSPTRPGRVPAGWEPSRAPLCTGGLVLPSNTWPSPPGRLKKLCYKKMKFKVLVCVQAGMRGCT